LTGASFVLSHRLCFVFPEEAAWPDRRAMDYPLLNLLSGLALVLTNTVSLGLAILLSKAHPRQWLTRACWLAEAISLCAAALVGYLFLRLMLPAISRQLAFGLVCIGGLGALATVGLYRLAIPPRLAPVMAGLQLLASLAGVVIALALYRSLVPLPPPFPA
jgi:hypothetical protein